MPEDIAGTKRLAAGTLLIVAIGISCLASWRLKLEERRPARTLPYFYVFGATLGLSFVAGRLAWTARVASSSGVTGRTPIRSRALAAIAAAGALGCSSFTWYLQGSPRSPWLELATWSGALLACVVAFSAGGAPSLAWPMRRFGGVGVTILLVLILAASARLIGLDSMPPYMGGDEANQVVDGLATMRGGVDVLGIGWGATGRLGMLPGGVGATVFADPIAGPRLPYAVAGTLSVVACTVAAGLVAGPWGALACAALLAFSPHHVHFSRLASVQILDALAAGLLFLLLLAVHLLGSASLAALAGIVGGLALYGYNGGRAITVAFLLMLPFTVLTAPKRRKVAVLLGLVAGFAIASAPNFRYAFRNYGEWNGRLTSTSILLPDYWNSRMAIFGSAVKVWQDQFLSGTIDLLSRHLGSDWFQGYPLIAPFFLVPLFLAGLGWMVGHRQFFGAAALSLVAAGNLAGLILTASAPTPQRASSLVPAMAILGGAAIGGLLSLLPERDGRGISWRSGAGAILIAGVLACAYKGPPRVWDPSPGYGGDAAAFTTALYRALGVPRFSQEEIYLHSIIDSHVPLFAYFLPRIRWIDVQRDQEQQLLLPGLHIFFRERVPLGRQWKERLKIRYAMSIAGADQPLRVLALMLRVPG